MNLLPFKPLLDIKNPDHQLLLKEPEHEYSMPLLPYLKFTSVTGFIEEFFSPFNEGEVAAACANTKNKKSKYYQKTIEQVLQMWETTREVGHIVHAELENWFKDRTNFPQTDRGIAGMTWAEQHLPPHWEYYPELRIAAPPYRLAGTADLLVHNTDKDTWFLLDWKTNSKILKTGYKMGTHDATKHIVDSNYWHYSLQLSIYKMMLEEYYGIHVKDMAIVHLLEDPDPLNPWDLDFYQINYLKHQVIKMFNHREWQLKNNLIHFPATEPIWQNPWD